MRNKKQSKSNKINNIIPFNYTWVGSCFHHAVCAVMPYYGIRTQEYLLSLYNFYKEELSFENFMPQEAEEKFSALGLSVQNAYFGQVEDVIKLIDDGVPVIAGIDVFYQAHRVDTFGMTHAHHFVLIYGYDRTKKVFHTIDHGFVNSPNFHEMELSFETYVKGNAAFSEYFGQDNSSGKLVYKDNNMPPFDVVKILLQSKERIAKSLRALEQNIAYLKELINVDCDVDKQNLTRVGSFLHASIINRNILIFCDADLDIEGLKDVVDKILVDMFFINAVIGRVLSRNDTELYRQKVGILLSRLDNVLINESKLHNLLGGKVYE